MRFQLFIAILFFNIFAYAGGPRPFLFMPRIVKTSAILTWDSGASYVWESISPYTHTFTLQNTGSVMTSNIAITFSGGARLTKTVDNCNNSILLPGGQCTIDVYFDGGAITPGTLYMNASDSVVAPALVSFTGCPGC